MARKSLSLKEKTIELLHEYAKANNLSDSAAADKLLNQALGTLAINSGGEAQTELILERFAKLEERHNKAMEDLSERIAKTAAKGTKASLANLIFTATYLPAIGNLTDSTHHITRKAWETLGFEVRDQRVESDQATLLELREKTPADMLRFSWAAGGRASVSGATMNYAELTRGLIDHKFSADELAGLPEGVIDLLEQKVIDNQDHEIIERLVHLNKWIDKLKIRGAEEGLDSIDRNQLRSFQKEREELKEIYIRRREKVISKIRTCLVPAGDGTWKLIEPHE